VTNRTHIHVRFCTFKLTFCHFDISNQKKCLDYNNHSTSHALHGAHDADRTRDLSLTKGVLYH
jgi:hypothetical protein